MTLEASEVAKRNEGSLLALWRVVARATFISSLPRSAAFRSGASNAAYSVADYLAQGIFMIAAAPFLVSRLGLEQYGIWMLANAIAGTIGVFNLGLGDSTIKFVAAWRGRNDSTQVRRMIRAILTLSALLGGVAGVAVFLSAGPFVRHVFKIEVAYQQASIHAIQIGGLVIALRSMDSVFANTLRAFDNYRLMAKVSIGVRVATVGSAVLLVAFHFGVVAIMWATAAATFLGLLFQAAAIRRLVPIVSFWPAMDIQAWRDVFGFSFYIWLQSVAAAVFMQADRLLVGALVGTAAVASYSICVQLAQPIHAVSAAAFNFLFPYTSRKHSAGDTEGLRRVFRLGVLTNFLLTALLSIPLVVFGRAILTVWMGADFAEDSSFLLAILAISFGILALNVVPHYTLLGLGKARFVSLANVVGGLLSLIGSAWLIPGYGLIGASIARLLYGLPTTATLLRARRELDVCQSRCPR